MEASGASPNAAAMQPGPAVEQLRVTGIRGVALDPLLSTGCEETRSCGGSDSFDTFGGTLDVLDFQDTATSGMFVPTLATSASGSACLSPRVPGRGGFPEFGIDLEQILQGLLLQEGLLEDHEAVASTAPAPGLGAAGNTTLRGLRQTGPLAELTEEVQTELLGGTLYEYGLRGEPWSPPRTTARDHSGAHSPVSAAPPIRGAPLQRGLSDMLRLSLDRILQNSSRGGLLDFDASATSGFEPDSTVYTARSVNTALSSSAGASPRAMTRSGEHLSEALFTAPSSPSRTSVQGLQGWPRVPLASLQGAPTAQDVVMEETTSVWGFGDTIHSTTSTGQSASVQHSARTVLGDTSNPDTGPDDPISSVLSRLAFENLVLDESLTRSVRRVLQLGTVLAGQRLADDEIRDLPKVRFDQQEEQSCSICLEPYQQGELLTALRCQHFFHVECVARWFKHSSLCPLCRQCPGE